MRIFKLILLNTDFLSKPKNKNKALKLINLGIFLTIFAISSSIITFVVETKISNKEEDLIFTQIEVNENSKMISELESLLSIYENIYSHEEDYMIDKEYLANTNFGSKLFSQKDFYYPYIYITLKDLEFIFSEFKTEEFDVFDKNDQLYKDIINELTGIWDEDEINDFKIAISQFSDQYKNIQNLNLEDFNFSKIPNYANIVDEIKNSKNNDLLSDEMTGDIHENVRKFDMATLNWFKQTIKYFKSTYYYQKDLIDITKKQILDLSNKEKNIILITFIFQFFIFVIIQFFEVASFTLNLKKNEKKI